MTIIYKLNFHNDLLGIESRYNLIFSLQIAIWLSRWKESFLDASYRDPASYFAVPINPNPYSLFSYFFNNPSLFSEAV